MSGGLRVQPTHPGGLAIFRLRDEWRKDSRALERFFASHTFPLVEGPCSTFIYRGAAEAVFLQHFIFGLPTKQPFELLEGTDVWFLVVNLPPRSRVEYKLEVVERGRGRWIEDPLNPNRARDPFGANSVLQGEGYRVPEWSLPHPETRPGSVLQLQFASEFLGGPRRVSLYLPARFRRTRRYPLLVVHDGGDFLNYASMQTVLDNLIHRMEVQEMVVALTHPEDRLEEYANNTAHADYLTRELVPALEKEFPLEGTPEGRALMGASFGAVAALSTAWRHPGTYGKLLLQSGSFTFTDIGTHDRGPMFDRVVEFVNAFRDDPRAVAERVYVSCGVYERLIYENRSLVPLLQSTGMQVRYTEVRDGHNWENWRDRLQEGLSWLFPGSLWMVYE